MEFRKKKNIGSLEGLDIYSSRKYTFHFCSVLPFFQTTKLSVTNVFACPGQPGTVDLRFSPDKGLTEITKQAILYVERYLHNSITYGRIS